MIIFVLKIQTTSMLPRPQYTESNDFVSANKTDVRVGSNKELISVTSKKHIQKSNKHNKSETVSTGYFSTTSNFSLRSITSKKTKRTQRKYKNVVSGPHQQNTYGKSKINITQVLEYQL
jgi:hypothetical protein